MNYNQDVEGLERIKDMIVDGNMLRYRMIVSLRYNTTNDRLTYN